MKFLVTAQAGTTPLPPEQAVNLLQASKAWIGAALANGTMECVYNFPSGGGFGVANVDSTEAALDMLLDYPMYAFFDWEVEAICEWSHTYDAFIKFWQKMTG